MTPSAILSDPVYGKLKDYVLSHTGLAYFAGKDEDFAARLSRRLAARGVHSCSRYLDLLGEAAGAPSEIDALVGELTIGETFFFRQPEQFDFLRSVILPGLLHANREVRQLRIWSAGCAIGAEPYSVAIILQREFGIARRDWNVSILGTDINVDFLAQARTGIFSEWALRDMAPNIRACCFRREGNGWMLLPEYREAVTFRYYNLVDDRSHPAPDELPFDLILCRNVMIYFSPERIRALSRRFHGLLNAGGWLLPGYAEFGTEMFPDFEIIAEAGTTVYRKPPGEAPVAPHPAAFEFPPASPAVPEQRGFSGDALFRAAPPRAEIAAHGLAHGTAHRPSRNAEMLESARILADRGSVDEAAAICRRLLDADALNAPAHFTLGLIFAHTGFVAEASEHLKRAIYVDRQFALAHYYLGTVLQGAGDRAGAQRAFRNALELLDSLPPEKPLEHGDGIQTEELRALARMHQGLIGG